jgi:hypothetical protein
LTEPTDRTDSFVVETLSSSVYDLGRYQVQGEITWTEPLQTGYPDRGWRDIFWLLNLGNVSALATLPDYHPTERPLPTDLSPIKVGSTVKGEVSFDLLDTYHAGLAAAAYTWRIREIQRIVFRSPHEQVDCEEVDRTSWDDDTPGKGCEYLLTCDLVPEPPRLSGLDYDAELDIWSSGKVTNGNTGREREPSKIIGDLTGECQFTPSKGNVEDFRLGWASTVSFDP